MLMLVRGTIALCLLCGFASSVIAGEFKPAVVFDVGGKQDKSFNEAAFEGAARFQQETGIAVTEAEITSIDQRAKVVNGLADLGYSPIIAVGYGYAPAIDVAALAHPELQFAIIDSVVDRQNVASVIFREQEGSYIVGVLAAMASRSGKLGFVGGMDISLIWRFACGFRGGVKSVNPEAMVLQDMIGTTDAAWRNPEKGAELARKEIEAGADVIFHAAGGSGVGVLNAAADAGVLGIGVDSNQDGQHPGQVLTSMLKHVDVAVYDTLKAARESRFEAGLHNLGVADGAVGWALDDNNRSLITPAMEAAAKRAASDIAAGKLQVHDFIEDNSCPY